LITLIVDADDTLWENNIYYNRAVADFAALMTTLGFERGEAERTVHQVEQERVPVVGYGPNEFVNSLVVAYERLCARYGASPTDEVAAHVRQIGETVLRYPIVLLDGVAETLVHLKAQNSFRLLLLTKGDPAVQRDKLERSGLAPYFDGVHVVPEKDATVLQELVAQYGLAPDRTWMVGNSPRSDINTAVEAGIGAVYVPHPDTWNLELEEVAVSDRVVVIERFADLIPLFTTQESR